MNGKTFETLRARAALNGIALEQIEDDTGKPTFIATAGPRTKPIATQEEASSWLDRVEAGLSGASPGNQDEA